MLLAKIMYHDHDMNICLGIPYLEDICNEIHQYPYFYFHDFPFRIAPCDPPVKCVNDPSHSHRLNLCPLLHHGNTANYYASTSGGLMVSFRAVYNGYDLKIDHCTPHCDCNNYDHHTCVVYSYAGIFAYRYLIVIVISNILILIKLL